MSRGKNLLDDTLLKASIQTFNSAQSKPVISFTELVEEHRLFCITKGFSEHTVQFYLKEAKAFMKSAVASKCDLTDITTLTTEQLQSFISVQFTNGFANSTIRSRMRAIKTILQFAVERGYLTKNPASAIPNVKVRQDVKDTYTHAHIDKLLKQPDIATTIGVRDRTIILFFARTGVRLTELHSINISDINMADGFVMIQRTKNGQARRIPFSKDLFASLELWLLVRKSMNPTTKALFNNESGTRLSVRQIQYMVRVYGKKAKLTDVTPTIHAFRRYFITEKIRAGVDLFVLASLVGHSDLSILQRYYKLYSTDIDKAIEMGLKES